MVQIIRSLKELNISQLMAVYTEGNRENAQEFYPELPEGQRILCAEQDFYQYLRQGFFPVKNAYYALWVEAGEYVSALRIEPYKDGVLLEALETHPEHRCRGYAEKLVKAVLVGERKVYSHVGKKNVPSLRVHEKCGFRRISEQAVYIDGSVNSRSCTLCYSKD